MKKNNIIILFNDNTEHRECDTKYCFQDGCLHVGLDKRGSLVFPLYNIKRIQLMFPENNT